MSETEALLLLLVSLGAALVPFFSEKLKLPTAVVEIAFGLVLGVLVSSRPENPVILDFLADLGFIILMYLAGLEINFEKLKNIPLKELLLAIVMYFIMIALSLLITLILSFPPVFSLVFFVTAVGLLFPVLRENRILDTDLGQRLLVYGSIGEIISLIAFTFFALHHQFGLTLTSVFRLGEIVLFVFLAALSYRLFKLLTWWFPAVAVHLAQKKDTAETGIRASLVNMFAFVALASLMHMEAIIGAFIGGALVAMVLKERENIQEKIGGMAYGFFIPLFFIRVGLRFEIPQLLDARVLLLSSLFSLLILLVRMVGIVPMIFADLNRRCLISLPLATAFPLTLLVAVATFGLESGMFDSFQASTVIMTAVITAVIYPLLFRFMLRKQRIFCES